jgi:hypothetical protein
MPGAIAKHVPGNNATLNALLYAAPATYGRDVSMRGNDVDHCALLTIGILSTATPGFAH